MKKIPTYLPLLIVVFLTHTFLYAQNTTNDSILFEKIKTECFKNNKFALRDVGTFINHPTLRPNALQFLQYITFFTDSELNWKKVETKGDFHQFFYKNYENIKYDELLGAWYLTPIEKTSVMDFWARPTAQMISPKKTLINTESNLQNSILSGDTSLFKQSVNNLAELRMPAAWDILVATAANEKKLAANLFPKNFPYRLHLINALKYTTNDNALKTLLKWLEEGKITASEAEIPLSEMTNRYINIVETNSMVRLGYSLLDSLGSLEAIKSQGFYELYHTTHLYFDQEIDYYTRLMSLADNHPWARNNAIEALIASHQPRSLFYLSTLVYRNRYRADLYSTPDKYLNAYCKRIEALTQLKISVQDASGATLEASTDRIWLLNYVRYWASHWKDYEWDEKRGYFINKLKAETLFEKNDRLFKLLSSSNDSLAINAFRQLSEGEPAEIKELAETYRQTARNFNPAVAFLKTNSLEQLTLLTDYCRDNGFDWHPSLSIQSWLDTLSTPLEPFARFQIENKLIQTIDLSDLTSIEYESFFLISNSDFEYSVARILDEVYTNNWNTILNTPAYLRLYLKKATLFSNIGLNGNCNSYLQKFNTIDPSTQSILQNNFTLENDPNIQKAVNTILTQGTNTKTLSTEQGANPSSPEKSTNAEKTFNENLQKINTLDTLLAEQINKVLLSSFYQPMLHKKACLLAIQKIANPQQLKRLSPNPKFSIKDDFKYFENRDLKPNESVYILKLFNGDTPEVMLAFLLKHLTKSSPSEKGKIITEALRTDWLIRYLISVNEKTPAIASIEILLKQWFDNNIEMTEYEEENGLLQLTLLETAGKSVSEKLTYSFGINVSESIKYRIQHEILALVAYKDLNKIAPLLENLSPDEQGQPGYLFLNKDFGLPPLDFAEYAEKELFIKNLNTLSIADCYGFYLAKFGVDIKNPMTQQLDFQKIYHILQFGILHPYAGKGGERRDWYVYACIKLLEEHFQNRLGFHEKLNENQTFYTFNAAKRAAVWKQYLEDNGLITTKSSFSNSWNILK